MIRSALIAASAAAALTLVVAWPVLRSPDTQLFGRELVGRHHDPYTVIQQYADGEIAPPYLQPATDSIGIALARVMPAVAAYNALVIASFVGAAATAYLHARHFIGPGAPAAIAALLFAFSPFHLAHASYHVHIAQVQWVPLVFLALWRALERPTLARGCALVAALALAGAASLYFGFILSVVIPCAALAYARASRRVHAPGRALTLIAGALAVTAAGTAALTWDTVTSIWNGSVLAFPASSVGQHSARWWSYLLPSALHPWWGEVARTWSSQNGIREGLLEQQVSLGAAVLALALAGLLSFERTRDHRLRPLILTAAAAMVCSLTFAAGWLHDLVPVFRAYARFGVIVSLMTTTMAGAGIHVLVRARGWGRGIATALILVAALEYLPVVPFARDVLPTAAHRAIADRADARVLDCGAVSAGSHAGLQQLMRAQTIAAGGLLGDCHEPGFGDKAAAFGLTHVIVRREPSGTLDVFSPPDGTRVVQAFEDASLLEVTAPRPPVYVGDLAGFYEREYRDHHSWRWMPRRGALTVVNTTREMQQVTVDIELASFATTRQLAVVVEDVRLTVLSVPPAWHWYRLGPLPVPAGTTTVWLVSDTGTSPAAVNRSEDRRELSVRVRGWRVHTTPAAY